MEEDDIAFFHFEVDDFAFEALVLLDAEVSLIDFSIIGVGVIVKLPQMSFGAHLKCTVLNGAVLKSCPGCDDVVGWAEGEVG